MSNNICWMLQLQVQDGKADALRALMTEMVAATKANEPGTLEYEWHLSDDGTVCHLWERYADSDAALIHMGTFGEKYAERFMALLAPTAFTVYGSPSDAVRQGFEAFGPTYLTRVAGFSR